MRLVLPLLLLLATLGCSSVEPPSVRALGASQPRLTADGFSLAVDVEVTNPNTVALPLSGVEYDVAVEGVRVLGGKAPTGSLASVPAGGSAELSVPVEVRFADLLEARDALVSGISSGGDVAYRFDGKALYAPPGTAGLLGNVLPKGVPFHYEGTLPVRDALRDPRNLANDDARKLATELLGNFWRR